MTRKELRKKIYAAWDNMNARCYNENRKDYKYYGGRGITVIKAWRKTDDRISNKRAFKSFYQWSIMNGVKPSLEIDRINNNRSYSPKNCRWTTHTNNMRNTSVYHKEIKTRNYKKRVQILHREYYRRKCQEKCT
jgi:hypothetical protein